MVQLIAENLVKIYKRCHVVDNISLSINSGEIVGLMGPNGAGKTTTFYILAGITQQDSGRILIDKCDISLLPLYARARLGIGYLPQEASIFRRLNVFDNIMAVLQMRRDINSDQRNTCINDLMEEFNVSHLRTNIGESLSGGERRRVEIARALAAKPRFILLDEPFAGVDPISIVDIKKIIKHLRNRGLGVLITDHNVREVLDVCDRAYIIDGGRIIAYGSPTEILLDECVKQVYLGNEFRL